MMEQELIDEYNRGLSDGVRMNLKGETAYLEARIQSLTAERDELLKGMHWLPMTPDAVFEDGDKYLIRKANGYVEAEIYMKFENEFFSPGYDEWTTREQVTHYARITEPK